MVAQGTVSTMLDFFDISRMSANFTGPHLTEISYRSTSCSAYREFCITTYTLRNVLGIHSAASAISEKEKSAIRIESSRCELKTFTLNIQASVLWHLLEPGR